MSLFFLFTQFIYLGSIIQNDEEIDVDVNYRIQSE